MSFLWNEVPSPVFTSTGAFARGALVYFYTDNSTTPLIVYQNAELTAPHPWPVVASMNGVFPPIYIPYVTFRRRVTTADGVLISDAGDISNPPPPSGGGGVIVTADQVFQTGDPIWRLRVGQMAGFVRMNGQTLGNAASGATEYAASDAANLFSFLWINLPNSIAAVSTGRGASAPADFAAGKTIVIPTMQGYLAAGVDDMGAAALGKIQAITTCTPTGASAVVPVADVTGIAVGQNVIINGVAAGVVLAIGGTNITLSVIPAAGAGVSWRSSFFSDAQQVGAEAGDPNAQPTVDQMPVHDHNITDPGHVHTYDRALADTKAAGGTGAAQSQPAQNTGSAVTGITINTEGGGNPFGILQPTRLGSYYMKL